MTRLNQAPVTRFADDSAKFSVSSLASVSLFCMDFDDYRDKVVDKYGMEHMVFEITNFLNSEGKILWIQDSEAWSSKIFLKPNMLFDLLNVLFMSDFSSNFSEIQSNKGKSNGNSEISVELMDYLKKELLQKGLAYMDLLKIIWMPIIFNDSSYLLNELVVLLMAYFYIGYPQVPKAKMKKIFQSYTSLLPGDNLNKLQRKFSVNTTGAYKNNLRRKFSTASTQRESNTSRISVNSLRINFDYPDEEHERTTSGECEFKCIVVPRYLPRVKNSQKLDELRNEMSLAAMNTAKLIALSNPQTNTSIVPGIALKYTFPWNLMDGIFERFSVSCIINTMLYYKSHWRDLIHAYDEQNTIG
jgi:hypothetical protein